MTSSDSARDLPRPAVAGPMTRWDRAASDRSVDGVIAAALSDPQTRVLAVAGDRVSVRGGGLSWSPPDRWTGSRAVEVAHWAFLGRDEGDAAIILAVVDPDAVLDHETTPSLRMVSADLNDAEGAVAVTAVSLARWLADAPFCPACGTRTEVRDAGWSRRCPFCGREHFPRTDPAVIVAITHRDDPDRLLLGSNAAWPDGRYSCFAGFVEAGESLEGAVRRELREEAGVEVGAVRYRSSQAWPYPRSLMLGFTAEAVDAGTARPDGEEIVSVRWFHRREIGEALAGRGELLLPGPASIAHRLISDWHAAGSA
ncbi:NAD(+) diphosphatase [Microbacterium invictum]|uniref:NAD(+) diphosphatase n=1 Tax=Microbacterium invictum TaxID=515415 RepID=A0ABZ0VEE7_9MICO|nr:NAD(+) diphosphatase [Microbacterium invictum]WQB71819.1 NAD(+) diphosphatase [Microbacterium invictum]